MCKLKLLLIIFTAFLIINSFPYTALSKSVGITEEQTNRTFVPIRFLSEQFGYQVNWNPDDQQIQVIHKQDILSLHIGQQDVHFNDNEIPNDTAPFSKNGVSYVPLRVIAESMGMTVEWDATNQQVKIGGNDRTIVLPIITEGRWKELEDQGTVQRQSKTFLIENKKISANLVIVDLLESRVSFGVGIADGQVGSVSKLNEMAEQEGAAIAMNGTFFNAYTDSEMKSPYGYIVDDGVMVKTAPGERRTVLVFDHNDNIAIESADEFLQRFQNGEIKGALQAGPQLLTDGQIIVNPQEEGFRDPKILTSAGARSAVGLTADHKLILLTTGGATIPQLAEIMRQAGAIQAMNMDGGASSGLYLQGKYITTPGREISNSFLVFTE